MTFLRRSDIVIGLLASLVLGYLWMAYQTGLERSAACLGTSGIDRPGGVGTRIVDGLDWPLSGSGQERCPDDAEPLPPKRRDRIVPQSSGPASSRPLDALPPKLDDRIPPQGSVAASPE